MGGLAEHNATTLGGNQFVGSARAIHKIGEVHGRNHAKVSDRSAGDDLVGPADREIETVAMADDELNPGIPNRIDDGLAFGQCERQGLFDQDMFAGGGQGFDLFDMPANRCCQIDRVDISAVEQRFQRLVTGGVEILLELGTGLGARVGTGDQRDPGVFYECRQHNGEGTPHPDDAHINGVLGHYRARFHCGQENGEMI